MNPFEMVVAIIVVVTIGKVLQARYGVRKGSNGHRDEYDAGDAAALAENTRLREELRTLRERVQVLERVVTDSETSSVRLDREIESLRDRK